MLWQQLVSRAPMLFACAVFAFYVVSWENFTNGLKARFVDDPDRALEKMHMMVVCRSRPETIKRHVDACKRRFVACTESGSVLPVHAAQMLLGWYLGGINLIFDSLMSALTHNHHMHLSQGPIWIIHKPGLQPMVNSS